MREDSTHSPQRVRDDCIQLCTEVDPTFEIVPLWSL